MRFRAVIFDFDGTLVRSHGPVYQVVEQLTRRRRREPMPTPEAFRDLSMRELLAVLNVRSWQIPWFTFRARRALRPLMEMVELEPGLAETLRHLRTMGVRLAVVSSNSRCNVERVLSRHDVLDLFEVISVGSSLFGKHRLFARAVEQLDVRPDEVVTVGDETRDIEAARRAGLKVVAVGWGLQTPAKLRASNPDFAVSTPAELASVLS